MRNKRYTINKKNGGEIPPLPIYKGKEDRRVLAVPVKCGKCMECLKAKAREWQIRLAEEIKTDGTGQFVTLTFSNESLRRLEEQYNTVKVKTEVRKVITDKNGKQRRYFNTKKVKMKNGLKGYDLENELVKLAIRYFLERWRKKHGKSVKHWLVTELGQNNTERIHVHGLIFTKHVEDIDKIWDYGNTYVGDYVTEKTINYIVKYLYKQDGKHKEYKPLMRNSKGLGKGFVDRIDALRNRFQGKDTIETYKNRKGYEMGMPVYYRNLLWTEEEREKLWLQRLDEEVRYVNGVKVDISNGSEDYWKLLKEEQAKNKLLGYNDDKINWKRRKYENERRQWLKSW